MQSPPPGIEHNVSNTAPGFAPQAPPQARRGASVVITPHAVQRSCGGTACTQKEAATRACCNAMLSAYTRAAPPQTQRALMLLLAMQGCATCCPAK